MRCSAKRLFSSTMSQANKAQGGCEHNPIQSNPNGELLLSLAPVTLLICAILYVYNFCRVRFYRAILLLAHRLKSWPCYVDHHHIDLPTINAERDDLPTVNAKPSSINHPPLSRQIWRQTPYHGTMLGCRAVSQGVGNYVRTRGVLVPLLGEAAVWTRPST